MNDIFTRFIDVDSTDFLSIQHHPKPMSSTAIKRESRSKSNYNLLVFRKIRNHNLIGDFRSLDRFRVWKKSNGIFINSKMRYDLPLSAVRRFGINKLISFRNNSR